MSFECELYIHWLFLFLQLIASYNRGSSQWSSSKGHERAIVSPDEHWNFFKGSVGEWVEYIGASLHR